MTISHYQPIQDGKPQETPLDTKAADALRTWGESVSSLATMNSQMAFWGLRVASIMMSYSSATMMNLISLSSSLTRHNADLWQNYIKGFMPAVEVNDLPDVVTGDLGKESSFFFRGPDMAFNLQAHNLQHFVTLAEQVGDAIWLHHLRQGDYTHWFRTVLQDEVLTAEALGLEQRWDMTPHEMRARIISLICERYGIEQAPLRFREVGGSKY